MNTWQVKKKKRTNKNCSFVNVPHRAVKKNRQHSSDLGVNFRLGANH